MSLLSSAISMIAVILVYLFLVRIYTILFRMTGISKEKARFQVISMLTSAGYTTKESEIIVSDKTRRNIATAAMITGYFFSVVIVSLLVNLFTTINYSQLGKELITLLIAFGSLITFLVIFHIPPVRRLLDHLIEKFTFKIYKSREKENYVSVVDSYGNEIVANVYLKYVPECLEGKTILKSNLKRRYGVTVLMYTRKDRALPVTKDVIFTKGDIILCFGKMANIQEAFNVKKGEIKKSEEQNINDILIIDNLSTGVLAQVTCTQVPPLIEGKTIFEAKLKEYYNINLVMITRDGESVEITKDTKIENGDTVILYGKYDNIAVVFKHYREKIQEEKEQEIE